MRGPVMNCASAQELFRSRNGTSQSGIASASIMRSSSQAYAIAQSVLFCAFAAVVLFDPSTALVTGGVVRAAGLLLAVIGLAIMFAALAALRNVVQIAPEPRPGGHLVTSGIYSRLRHPIYTGIVVIVIGVAMRSATPAVLAVGAGVIVFLLFKTRYEEALLQTRYPDYSAYRSRTWGVIPLLR